LEIILKGNQPRCPLDKKDFCEDLTDVSEFPINFTVQGLIEENPQWEVCQTHGERIKLMCFTDRCKVCAYCALDGVHREHEVRHINEIKPDIDEKKKKIEVVIKNIDNYYNGVNELLDQKRESALRKLEERFKEFVFLLRIRKGELANEIHNYFDNEKIRVSSVVGKESSLIGLLNNKIHLYRNYSKSEDPFNILEEDISQFILNYDFELLRKNLQGIKDKITEKVSAFDKDLINCLNFLNDIKTPNKEFIEKLAVNYADLEDGEGTDLGAGNSSFCVESSVRITNIKPYVHLLLEDKERKNNFVSSKDFKEVPDMFLEIKKPDLDETEIDLIEKITYRMNRIQNVKILMNKIDEKYFEETSLLDLCSIVLYKPNLLTGLTLDFTSTKFGNLTFDLLSKNILSKAISLKTINLLLAKSNISDRGISAFTNYALPYMGALNCLSIDLANTNVSDEEMGILLMNIPNVQFLNLNFKETKIKSQNIEDFLQNKLPNLTTLKEFEMILADTTVSGDLKTQVQQFKQDIASKSQKMVIE